MLSEKSQPSEDKFCTIPLLGDGRRRICLATDHKLLVAGSEGVTA